MDTDEIRHEFLAVLKEEGLRNAIELLHRKCDNIEAIASIDLCKTTTFRGLGSCKDWESGPVCQILKWEDMEEFFYIYTAPRAHPIFDFITKEEATKRMRAFATKILKRIDKKTQKAAIECEEKKEIKNNATDASRHVCVSEWQWADYKASKVQEEKDYFENQVARIEESADLVQ
jgi:hypothetical protein